MGSCTCKNKLKFTTQTWNKETVWVKIREKGQIYTFLTLKNDL